MTLRPDIAPAGDAEHAVRAGFPIDRDLTSDLLGFDGPTGNTYGSIATVDYLLESASAAAVLTTGLGRFVQDLLLWCTVEFGYLRLGEGFVQSSTIMPQKRNPVALEHARAIGSKALGQVSAIMMSVHRSGLGIAGIFTHDVAETKVRATQRAAEEQEFPLLVTMEPETENVNQ